MMLIGNPLATDAAPQKKASGRCGNWFHIAIFSGLELRSMTVVKPKYR
jgi:hypothetical protein